MPTNARKRRTESCYQMKNDQAVIESNILHHSNVNNINSPTVHFNSQLYFTIRVLFFLRLTFAYTYIIRVHNIFTCPYVQVILIDFVPSYRCRRLRTPTRPVFAGVTRSVYLYIYKENHSTTPRDHLYIYTYRCLVDSCRNCNCFGTLPIRKRCTRIIDII